MTFGFGPGSDLRIVELSPAFGLCAQREVYLRYSLPLPLPLLLLSPKKKGVKKKMHFKWKITVFQNRRMALFRLLQSSVMSGLIKARFLYPLLDFICCNILVWLKYIKKVLFHICVVGRDEYFGFSDNCGYSFWYFTKTQQVIIS